MENEKFISVIKAHQKLIYKVCYSYCSNQDHRKDLQQEILLQLWRSFSKFDGRVKMSTWIYRIALNTAISFYRKGQKHSHKAEALDESIISISNIEISEEKDENLALLFHFIEQLNEMDKALVLLYLDGNKYSEIGDVLGILESNVATKLSRIKKKLKSQFSNI